MNNILVTAKDHPQKKILEYPIQDAQELHLVVWDNDDGSRADWANWINPTLQTKGGKQVSLTSIKWKEAKAGFGIPRINKNAGWIGKTMKLGGQPVKGIGTHAFSHIIYRLPKNHDFVKFTSVVALDDAGVPNKSSTTASVIFEATSSFDKKSFLKLAQNQVTSATNLQKKGHYGPAGYQYLNALKIYRQHHPENCIHQLDMLYKIGFCWEKVLWKCEDAIPHIDEFVEISKNKKNKIEATLLKVRCFNNLGEFEKGLNLIERLRDSAAGNDIKEFESQIFHWIGVLKLQSGKPIDSIHAFEQAIEKGRQGQPKALSNTLHSLGKAFHENKEYQKAIDQFKKGLELNQDSRYKGSVYIDIAKSYLGLGKLEETEIYKTKGIKELKSRYNIENLRDVGYLHFKTGHLEEAKDLITRLANWYSQKPQPDGHPGTIDAFSLLADIYLQKGELSLSKKYAQEMLSSYCLYLERLFFYLTPNERLEFQSRFEPFSQVVKTDDSRLIAEAVTSLKGIVLDSIIEDKELESKNSNFKEIQSLIKHRSMLYEEYLNSLSSPLTSEKEKQELHNEIDSISGEISEKIGGGNRSRRALKITPEMISSKLPESTSLVDYIQYTTHDANGIPKKEYGAIIHSAKVPSPQWIQLGSALVIEDEVTKFIKSASNDLEASKTPILIRSLNHRLMEPVLTRLPPDTHTLILCPDGMLNFVPFSVLHNHDKDSFLIEKFNLLNTSTSRDILDTIEEEHNGKSYIFADPIFEEKHENETKKQVPLSTNLNVNKFAKRDISLSKLKGSFEEAQILNQILKENRITHEVLTGWNATEFNLRKVQRPYILHLATHGFFIRDKKELKNYGQLNFFGSDNDEDLSFNIHRKMRKSGILLAGAKSTFEDWEKGLGAPADSDGVVTAEEAGSLNLKGNWLTTLSACDTGGGAIQAGEGVFGLKRSFAKAGVQNLLLTLWPVSDGFHTIDFMKAFYQKVLKTKSAPTAFTKVQRDLLVKHRKKYSQGQAIRYIAPFVLTFRGPCPEMEAPPISASMASIKLSYQLKEDFLSKYAMLIGLAVALSLLTMGFFFYSRRSKG